MTDEIDSSEDRVIEYARAVEDLHHQLRSPAVQAYHRAQVALEALEGVPNSDTARIEVARVVALLAKVRGTMFKSQLFAKLSQGQTVDLHPTPIGESELVRTISDILTDVRHLLSANANIQFTCDIQLHNQALVADKTLLEQVMSNLLENAVKYSYPNTSVEVSTDVPKPGQLAVVVENTGLPITDTDTTEIFERGWRGDQAKLVTGEGSGIGLWINKNIMTAHGGDITVEPTSPSGRTRFVLTFPSRPR